MPDWAIWLIVAAALVGVEVFSLTLLFGPLALAALLGALLAGIGLGVALQVAAFAAAAVKVWIIPSEFSQALGRIGVSVAPADGQPAEATRPAGA